jgi:preprotein translocase subunit YajC
MLLFLDAAAEVPMQGSIWSSLLMFVPLILVFYFLIIRPQRKREKAQREMLNSMQVGDNVVSIGGIYGKIVELKDDIVVIEVGKDKVKLVFERNAIKSVDKPVTAD